MSRRRGCVARERSAAYRAREEPPPPSVLVGALREAVDALSAADLDDWSADELGEAALALERAQSQLVAQQARVLTDFERREGPRADACTTAAAWLNFRTRLGAGAVQRRMSRARQLGRMSQLRAAYQAGEVATEHVDAVVRRCGGWRGERIAEHDATLAELARQATPREVAVAVERIIDAVASEGGDNPPPPCDAEDLRELSVRDGFAGLGDLRGTLSPVLRELFLRVRDVYGRADPPDTPSQHRRTPGARFHDAVLDALTVALSAHPGSAVDGVKTHVVLFADLMTLLGRDDLARIRPRLSDSGVVDPEIARHLIATTNPTMRAVLCLGPWMPVSVGRSRRTLPDWLRGASELVHQRCRGPGCTLRFAVTQADHATDFADGGVTALFNDDPLCLRHHGLKHRDGWDITFHTSDGVVRWRSRDGTRTIDVPPPDP